MGVRWSKRLAGYTAVMCVLTGGVAAQAAPLRAGFSRSRRAHAKGTLVSGQIYLREYSCLGDPMPKERPFTGAAVVLDRPGNAIPAVAWLDSKGRFSTRVHGHGHIQADLILEDRQHLVKVIPDGASRDIYRIGIWLDPGRNARLVLYGPGADAANVFQVGLRAARYTRRHHVHVPEATFEIHYRRDTADQDGSYYTLANHTIHINNWASRPDLQNAWEPFTITHEYGHHVLDSLAPPPSMPSGQHEVNKTYPGIPGLAYNEGFAHAFAGLVLNNPNLGYGCQHFMHLGRVPATPLADRPVFAQFNETAAGAAMWRVLKQIGLHDFVYDMVGYKGYAGHYPDDMRQAREALIPSEHGSAAQDVAFSEIFGQQNLRWGTLVSLTHEPTWDGTVNGTDMLYEVHLTLTGPYGHCEANAKPGQYGADPSGDPGNPFTPKRPALVAYPPPQNQWDSDIPGDLGYTWQDECLTETADGQINPQIGSFDQGTGGLYATKTVPSAQVLFPYLAGAAQHKGEFTLSARFVCVPPDPSDDPGEGNEPVSDQEACGNGGFALDVYNGLVKGLNDKVITNNYGPAGPDGELRSANYWTSQRIELPYNQDEPLVKWSANGTCKILITGQDCSTATIAR